MSEWHDNQKKLNGNFRKLLEEIIKRANPSRNLTAEEAKHIDKFEGIAGRLFISRT